MNISSDLISQLVKVTNDTPETKKDSTVYGTIKEYEGSTYVQIDGSDQLTPVSTLTTTKLSPGERVIVTIKNHSAVVTGNLTSPSARWITDESGKKSVEGLEIGDVVLKVDTVLADNVEVKNALKATEGDISKLKTDKLDATVAKSTYATIENLSATNTEVNTIKGEQATFKQTTTDKLSSVEADIKELSAKKLSATDIEGKYANIDFSNIGTAAVETFYAVSGIIKNLTLESGTVVKELVGVLIKGDLIEGGTIAADKLIVKGEDGLYYKLNVNALGETTAKSDPKYQNGLDGSVIIAKSIAAEKISVSDLKAFGATIGGFSIGESAIHSVAKTSASNTTRGIYMDNLGQFVVGDASNYIKYFKDTDGQYKLDISMMSKYATKTDLENMEIGGRNFIPGSRDLNGTGSTNYNSKTVLDNGFTAFKCTGNWHGVSRDANNLILDSKAGDKFTYSVNFKTSSTCVISFFAMCYTSDGARVYPEVATGEFNNKKILTSNSDEEQDQRVRITFSVAQGWIDLINDGGNIRWTLQVHEGASSDDPAYLYAPKLERGDKATDWTPAPEDMATTEDAEKAQTSANTAQETASSAESLVKQLADSISMLVTDGNGTSLMTQTEDGWTFSTAEINSSVNDISDALATLTESAGSTEHSVAVLQEAVRDLGEIAEYVSITTYEDEPCIELGEGDSEFKLRITNTRMLFTEGSTVLAYFTNQSFHSKSVVVEEELQQGGFVWAVRSNGNLGLSWKGVTS